MALVADLEKPFALDSPLAVGLLEPRPSPPVPPTSKPAPFKFPAPLSSERKEELQKAYWQHVASPAPSLFGGQGKELSSDEITTVIPERAWVVPQLLSKEECAEVMRVGEEFGLESATPATGAQGLRTNKRTGNYCNPELAALVAKRMPTALLEAVEETKPHTSVRGIHPNWRVGRYDPGDFFAAHYDQADSLTVQTEHGKERYDSSHTLLISLSKRSEFEGGATRLWPTGSYDDTAVDVELPQGYALVFQQRLLHSGLAVRSGIKHIAQVGILRGMPQTVSSTVSTFRFGPGLQGSISQQLHGGYGGGGQH
jgi:predicted 2-oxoglutarate/Fe(II)-dependent dioxygenase YbiX